MCSFYIPVLSILFRFETKSSITFSQAVVKDISRDQAKARTEKQNDQIILPDARIRQLKDQLIQARLYLTLSATRNNPHFVRDLRLRMKEVLRVLGDATKDSELPRK